MHNMQKVFSVAGIYSRDIFQVAISPGSNFPGFEIQIDTMNDKNNYKFYETCTLQHKKKE